MAIPLPQVVSDVGPGGPLVTSMRGMNALLGDMYGNQIKGSEAEYAPYTNYSNVMSKLAYANYLPYQLQAQVLGNPMLWMALKDNPEALQGMMNNFVSSIPQMGNLPGVGQVPAPSPRGNGLLSMLVDKLKGNPQNAMAATPQPANGNALMQPPSSPGNADGSPLVPGSRGGMSGVIGKMTAPYNQQIVEGGKTFYDPQTGKIISAPSGKEVTSLQSSINAAQRVAPQLERIAEEGKPFMTLGGKAKVMMDRIGNFAFGGQNKSPSDYAKFQADLKAAPEALVKSYGLNPTNETIQRMADVIEPIKGESSENYAKRILQQLDEIKREQVGLGEKQLAGGFDLSSGDFGANNRASDEEVEQVANKGIENNQMTLPGGLIVPRSFASKEAFHAWWEQQPSQTKRAYQKYLEGK